MSEYLWDPIEPEVVGEGGPVCELIEEDLTARKPGPVVIKRKREGIALCKVYDPEKPPKWKHVIFEPKFDGYRCIAVVRDGKATLLTSTGLPHWNVRYIQRQLEATAAATISGDNIALDGEIVHDTLPFDVAGGILRKHEDDPRAEGFVLHVWDWIPLVEFDAKIGSMPLTERKSRLHETVNLIWEFGSYISLVQYQRGTLDKLDSLSRQYVIEDGQEGIILKDADAPYNFGGKKGNCWLKWKPKYEGEAVKDMKEGDFRITGIKPGRGKHFGRVGAIYITGFLLEDGNISPDCPDPNGENNTVTGRAGTGLDDAQREQFQKWFDEGTLVGR